MEVPGGDRRSVGTTGRDDRGREGTGRIEGIGETEGIEGRKRTEGTE